MTDVFTGPYSAGPPAEALAVRRPSLRWFGPAELLRIVVVLVVLGGGLLVGQVRWLVSRWYGRTGPNRAAVLAEAAVTAFSRLGPVFTKLGQFMASSPGLFPAALSNAARRCLDDMPPFPARRAHRLIAEQLGAPVSRLFAEFTDRPLAAASIAQVHACVLTDGRAAVVKLRRPGIERRMITDLRIMYRIALVLDRHVELARLTSMVGVVEQLYEGNCQELNFALEASQQQRFRAAIGAFEDNRGVMVPEVYWDYCGPGMICMERVYGVPMDNPEQLAEHGLDGELPLRRGVKAWLEAAILQGPFHGDAHAGNLWILNDGRLGYLDFGIMGELAPPWRRLIRDVLYTLMFDRNFERVASALRECGVLTNIVGTDAQLGWTLRALFEPLLDSPVSGLDTRKIIELMLSTARQHAGENPPELTLFAKQLVYFERYSAALAPDWVFAADPYVVRNIFPAESAARAAQLGLTMPD